GMVHHELPGMTEHLVIDMQRGPDGSTAVSRGRLHVDVLERRLAEDPAVGHAVQGHAAGQAEAAQVRSTVERPHHRDQDLFGDVLNTGRDIRIVLVAPAQLLVVRWAVAEIGRISRRLGEEVALGVSWWTKELLEFGREGRVR